ncbi:hypothetical protein [Catenuloplanes indicus]|uniref:Uncharacterized protein n=1 Tax=Catenuloplanes indicus TaxID=137267 RepID=A0AAE3W480_9ACTN|nr:hypothetical protein [Catenuloplanes indicus]
MPLLDESVWRAREAAHQARVDTWIVPHLERRRRGIKHPVLDFLFRKVKITNTLAFDIHAGQPMRTPGLALLPGTRGE